MKRSPFVLVAAAWSSLLTLVLTWPGVLRLNSAVLGDPAADGLKHVWTLWWMRRSVWSEGRFPYTTELVNFPYGMDLYPIEPLNGLAAVLLGGAPLVATTNLLAMLNLTLIGVCGALLGRALAAGPEGGGRAGLWGGLAAGTLLQGAAISLFTIHVGVGELQHLWWLPLGFTAWLACRRQPSPARAVALGGALAGAVLSCFYHGFFLAVGVSVLSLLTLWAGGVRATGRLLLAYALAAGLSLAVVVPVTASFATSYGKEERPAVGLKAYVLEDHGQPDTDPPAARLDPAQLITPARSRRAVVGPSERAYGGGRYLGFAALTLLAGALLRRPRRALPWLGVAAAGVVIAMGSYAVRDGADVLSAEGLRLRLPFFYVNRALGYLAEPLNFPVRAVALVATSAAAAAGLVAGSRLAGRSLGPAAAALALLSVVEVQAFQLNPRPMASLELTPWPELAPLAEQTGAMVDLTLAWNTDLETLMGGLSAQVAHGQRIQAVPVERLRYFAMDGQYDVQALALVEDSRRAQRAELSLDPAAYRGDLALLREAGFTRILVHGIGPHREIPRTVEDCLTGLLGAPEIATRHAMVWTIPELQYTAEELATWEAARRQRVEALKRQPPRHRGPGD